MTDELFSDLDDAIYRTVRDYRCGKHRGAAALALRVGMQPGTLANKANPLQDHQLTLSESIPVQLQAQDFRILQAYSAALGHAAWPLPDARPVGDISLLESYCNVHDELGCMARELRDALRDHRITRAEVTAVRQAFERQVSAGLGLLARFEVLADE